jgi:hypothetical protein
LEELLPVQDFQDNIIDNAATITTTANSAAFIRPEGDVEHSVVVLVNIGANPTGTTPTLTYKLQSSLDGTNWFDVASTSALNAQSTARLEAKAIEPQWRVAKTIGGTASPTFTLVTSHLLFLQ